ncbi:MAG: CBS domain-containing protein [Gemmatimonadales bacterium]|jgi:CBS domain-containing protein
MRLLDLLAPDRVLVPLEATTLTDAGSQLAHALVVSGVVDDPETFLGLLEGGMPRDVVTFGPAFLLHYRTEAVNALAAAIGVSKEPIARDPDSGKEARLVILLVGPPRETSPYLQAMSTFARAFGHEEVVEALLHATSPQDVLEAAPLAEVELPGYLTVRDVMVRRRLSVSPETTLGETARLMVAHSVAAVPVVSEEGEVLGVVTHDEVMRYLMPRYLKRASGEFRKPVGDQVDPHAMPVRDVMDRSVLCVSADQVLADVAGMMLNRNVERFPVVDEGVLVGFLTRGEIVRRILGR